MIHPVVSGNKLRKLSFLFPGLEAATYMPGTLKRSGYQGILTFGGAHSNHVHALAWICKEYGVPFIVFVRSHDPEVQSPTMNDVRLWGGIIIPLSPDKYSKKENPKQINRWEKAFPGYLIIPEGGSHTRSLDGIGEMMREIDTDIPDWDLMLCPVGTGATMAGIIRHKNPGQWAIGISALKTSLAKVLIGSQWELDEYDHWTIADQWHFGGYGKVTKELLVFIKSFRKTHGILLDPLYNGKAMYAFYQYLEFNLIPPSSKVVFIHTGGLQGWRGLREWV